MLVVCGGRAVNSVLLQVVLDLRPSTFWKYQLDLQMVAKQQVVNQGLQVLKFNFHLWNASISKCMISFQLWVMNIFVSNITPFYLFLVSCSTFSLPPTRPSFNLFQTFSRIQPIYHSMAVLYNRQKLPLNIIE